MGRKYLLRAQNGPVTLASSESSAPTSDLEETRVDICTLSLSLCPPNLTQDTHTCVYIYIHIYIYLETHTIQIYGCLVILFMCLRVLRIRGFAALHSLQVSPATPS